MSFDLEDLGCVRKRLTHEHAVYRSQGASSSIHPLGRFTFRMGAPAPREFLGSYPRPTSIQQGQLPLPGRTSPYHPCQSLQRGWLTPPFHTNMYPSGRPAHELQQLDVKHQHGTAGALLHLPQDRGGGGVTQQEVAPAEHAPLPPALAPRLWLPPWMGGISWDSKRSSASASGFSKL